MSPFYVWFTYVLFDFMSLVYWENVMEICAICVSSVKNNIKNGIDKKHEKVENSNDNKYERCVKGYE